MWKIKTARERKRSTYWMETLGVLLLMMVWGGPKAFAGSAEAGFVSIDLTLGLSSSAVCQGNTFDATIGHPASPGDLALYYSTNAGLTATQLYDFPNHAANGILTLDASVAPTGTATMVNGVNIPGAGNYTVYAILASSNPNINPNCTPVAARNVQIIGDPVISGAPPQGCSEDIIQLSVNAPGGVWTAISTIGTSVDTDGRVLLGGNPFDVPDPDTIIYSVCGRMDTVIITVMRCNSTCFGQVNVTLGSNCTFRLQPSNVGGFNFSDTVIVNDGNTANGDLIDCAGKYDYGLFRKSDMKLLCWGKVLAEDKSAPMVASVLQTRDTFECIYLDEVLNDPRSGHDPSYRYYLGEVFFADNCAPCGCSVNKKFYDQIEYTNCNGGSVYARLHRKWTATDCLNNTRDTTITYVLVRPSLDSLIKVRDSVFQTCNPQNFVVPEVLPYWEFRWNNIVERVPLDMVTCNYSLRVEESKFEICKGSGNFELERRLRVYDQCNGSSIVIDTFTVKVGDFLPPTFSQGKDTAVISTGPMDCTAAFRTDQGALAALFDWSINDCNLQGYNLVIESYSDSIVHGINLGNPRWRPSNFQMIGNMALGVPVGLHRFIVQASDACHYTASDTLYFYVKDRVSPVMKCDDEINVTLTDGHFGIFGPLDAYARVDAADVDEGSWDNCGLAEMRVRRSVPNLAACMADFIAKGYDTNADGVIDEKDFLDSNGNGFKDGRESNWEQVNGVWFTPWHAFVEFFCCDAGQKIVVELRGWDNAVDPQTRLPAPNTNYCWLNILIEDGTSPVVSGLDTVVIDCLDPIVDVLQAYSDTEAQRAALAARFGDFYVGGSLCGNVTVNYGLTLSEAQGGSGFAQRSITVQKTGKFSTTITRTQTIVILDHHDYSICFPSDILVDCPNDPAISGITYEENGCDLLAVSSTDHQFNVTDNSACYKILRTYRVINWCEYDGESAPTIVGRDWDAANGNTNRIINGNPAWYRSIQGDNRVGDHALTDQFCVIVRRDFTDNAPDTVYYDADTNPFNNVPNHPGGTDGHWWSVVSGNADPDSDMYLDQPWGDAREPLPDSIRYGSNGFWEYTQHIVVTDDEPPTVNLTADTNVICTVNDLCSSSIDLRIEVGDNCADVFQVRVVSISLDLNNNGTIDRLGNVDGINTTNYPVLTYSFYSIPFGEHRAIVRVSDGCGNFQQDDYVFLVKDGKAPTPICINGLSADLMPLPPNTDADGDGDFDAGAIAIWSTDWKASEVYDCTGQGGTNSQGLRLVAEYYITLKGEPLPADPKDRKTSLTFTCDDLIDGDPIEIVWIWTVDGAGNAGYCETFFELQDHMAICNPNNQIGQIGGAIATEDQRMIEGVEVELSGGQSMMYRTDAQGKFLFEGLRNGYDYTLRPVLNQGHLNGVTTFDLVLISRHILGVRPFESPYQLIAADVNNSGSVSTIDLIELRKLILNITPTFSRNTSWRFIDGNYAFPERRNPWAEQFPEFLNINDLHGDIEANFMGVKIGDVNLSVAPNSAAESESRSTAGTYLLTASDQPVRSGVELKVPIRAEDLSAVQGLQFTLGYDTEVLELEDIEYGAFGPEHLGVFPEKGILTTSWTYLDGKGFADDRLFTLVFSVKRAGTLSKLLRLQPEPTFGEAYDLQDRFLGVALAFDETRMALDAFELFPNRPNPFTETTVIGLQLPQPERVALELYDLNGRLVHQRTAELPAGYQELRIQGSDLPAAGAYICRVKAGAHTANQKLIFLGR